MITARERLNLNNDQIELIVHRKEKGLTMTFYSNYVVKDYSTLPTYITVEDQRNRFINEVSAYQRFNELKCPFVPRLVDYSLEERWLCVSRIHGGDLLKVSQMQGGRLPIKSILEQLDEMNIWLRENDFPDTGSNTKDIILCDTGRLYMVDFEACWQDGESGDKPDIYNALVQCLLERVLVRKTRTAKLTRRFILLAIAILSKRPRKAIKYAFKTITLRLTQ